jgi:hypothetical protein
VVSGIRRLVGALAIRRQRFKELAEPLLLDPVATEKSDVAEKQA